MQIENQKFELGQIVATSGTENLPYPRMMEALERHATGDWGNVPQEDAKTNNLAIKHGGRILSSYTIQDEVVWIITESSREITTFLLPSEY